MEDVDVEDVACEAVEAVVDVTSRNEATGRNAEKWPEVAAFAVLDAANAAAAANARVVAVL